MRAWLLKHTFHTMYPHLTSQGVWQLSFYWLGWPSINSDLRRLPSFRIWQLSTLLRKSSKKVAWSLGLQTLVQPRRMRSSEDRKCFIWREAPWGWLNQQIPGIISSWQRVIFCIFPQATKRKWGERHSSSSSLHFEADIFSTLRQRGYS